MTFGYWEYYCTLSLWVKSFQISCYYFEFCSTKHFKQINLEFWPSDDLRTLSVKTLGPNSLLLKSSTLPYSLLHKQHVILCFLHTYIRISYCTYFKNDSACLYKSAFIDNHCRNYGTDAKIRRGDDLRAVYVTHPWWSYSIVTHMINSLGLRSLEQRRADARLIMFYKIGYGLVATPLSSYIQRHVRMTRTIHPMHFIQIQTTVNFYKYSFFPLTVEQWNNLPSQAVLSDDLSSFRPVICSLNHTMPQILRKYFYQLLTFLLPLTNTILLFIPH